jgi:hypothetical protein
MKKILYPLIAVFLLSATFKDINMVLYSYNKGKLEFSEGFLKLSFNKADYINGIGDQIECFVSLNKKIYLGSENKGEYKISVKSYTEKYQKLLKSKLGIIEYNPRLLKTETKNNRLYFYYNEHLITADIGRRTEDGRICISANHYKFQIKEKNILVALYINGELKFNQCLFMNTAGEITSKIDLLKLS